MNFKCHITQVPMTKACKLKSCMWSSVNGKGCMAVPRAPEPDELTDELIARHKGVPVETVVHWKTRGEARIDSVITVSRLFDWLTATPQRLWPWYAITGRKEAVEAVNTWCNKRWLYQVPELAWTPAKVAVTVHKPTLLKFNTHVGKQVDWLKLLGITSDDANALTKIFKSLSKEQI